jgi:hypothetical protein
MGLVIMIIRRLCKLKTSINKIPVGTRVKMVSCLEAEKYADRIWITRSEPWQIGSDRHPGKWIVLLEGFAGGFAVDCLEIQVDL